MQKHIYQVLQTLLTCDPSPMTFHQLSSASGIGPADLLPAIKYMMSDTDEWGVLITVRYGDYRIAGINRDDCITGGWAFLDECRRRPETCTSETAFRLEALTGMTSGGNQTRLRHAVLPVIGSGGRGFSGNVERTMNNDSRRGRASRANVASQDRKRDTGNGDSSQR